MNQDDDSNEREFSKNASILVSSDNPSAYKEVYNLDGSSHESQDLSLREEGEEKFLIQDVTSIFPNDDPKPSDTKTSSRPKHLKDIILVYLFYSTYIIGAFVYSFFIPNMLQNYVATKHPDFTKEQVLSMASHYKSFSDCAPYIMTFLCGPLIGVLSDKFGRKKIFCLVLFSQACDVSLALTSYKLNNLAFFYAGHLIFGITNTLAPSILSYVADITTIQERPKIYAMAGAPIGLGIVLGPIAGSLTIKISLMAPLIFVYGVICTAGTICFFLKESTDLRSEEQKEKIKAAKKTINPFLLIRKLFQQSKYVVFLTLLYVTFSFSSTDVISTYFMYTQIRYDWKPSYNGYFISYLGFMVMCYSGLVIPQVLKRISDRKTISCAFLLSSFVHFAYGLAFNQYIWIACGFFGGSTSVILNLTQGLISKSTPIEIQGSILTGVAAAGSISSFFGSLFTQNTFAYFISSNAPYHLPYAKIYLPGLHFIIDGFIIFLAFCGSLLIWKYYPNQFGKSALAKNTTPEEEEKLINN